MTAVAFENAYRAFAQAARPYLHITNHQHYLETLEIIEQLLERAEDDISDPTNGVIDLLSRAVEIYEDNDEEISNFDITAMEQPTDLTVLRILMDQYNLATADLPEIGSKSMVSRVLSGQRSLNKNHIKALCKRFNISPNLFF